jgi:hypothetical protein
VKVPIDNGPHYTGADRIADERRLDRTVDEKTDDYARLSNDALAAEVARIGQIFDPDHRHYHLLRLAAARLWGEEPTEETVQ